jgi:hypothetical protein
MAGEETAKAAVLAQGPAADVDLAVLAEVSAEAPAAAAGTEGQCRACHQA